MSSGFGIFQMAAIGLVCVVVLVVIVIVVAAVSGKRNR